MAEKKIEATFSILDWSTFLVIFVAISIVAQVFNVWQLFGISTAKTANVWLMVKGYAILFIGTVIGLMCAKYIRIGWPAVLWVSLVLIVASLPWLPTHKFVVETTKPVALLPMASPILAYAGLAIARQELKLFKEAGWKIVILACLTFIGSYFFSALIAHLVLKATGQI
jgi:hypothetical protein